MKLKTPVQPFPMTFSAESGFSTPILHRCVGLTSTDRAAREEILHRAYSIWENAGRPEKRELANWLEAEAEVLTGSRTFS
jgi:hypothetical protein